tara:strand:- start:301776 stop:302201 length:426 start_codon:yes stop_codon:yes gene_type:complete
MSIVDAFDSSEEKLNKSHIHNLIRLALADGILEESELERIRKIARSLGVTAEETNELLASPEKISFNAPSGKEERLDRFVNLVRVVIADGAITEPEEKLLRRISIGLSLSEEKLPLYINTTTSMLKDGAAKDEIVEALMKL